MPLSRDEETVRLVNALMKDKKMAGKFWYSKRQRQDHDKKGHSRFFAFIGNQVVEFTEMVDIEALTEDPMDMCYYEDAKYLGEGYFSHRVDANKL